MLVLKVFDTEENNWALCCAGITQSVTKWGQKKRYKSKSIRSLKGNLTDVKALCMSFDR